MREWRGRSRWLAHVRWSSSRRTGSLTPSCRAECISSRRISHQARAAPHTRQGRCRAGECAARVRCPGKCPNRRSRARTQPAGFTAKILTSGRKDEVVATPSIETTHTNDRMAPTTTPHPIGMKRTTNSATVTSNDCGDNCTTAPTNWRASPRQIGASSVLTTTIGIVPICDRPNASSFGTNQIRNPAMNSNNGTAINNVSARCAVHGIVMSTPMTSINAALPDV